MEKNEQELTSRTDRKKKKLSSSTKAFIIGSVVWSILFILIPLIIYLGIRDWTITLSITGKIGIGFILLGFILLGAVGTPKVTGRTAGMTIVDYTSSDDEGTSKRSKEKISFLEVLAFGEVMLLLWGVIYLIPFAFGIPFII